MNEQFEGGTAKDADAYPKAEHAPYGPVLASLGGIEARLHKITITLEAILKQIRSGQGLV